MEVLVSATKPTLVFWAASQGSKATAINEASYLLGKPCWASPSWGSLAWKTSPPPCRAWSGTPQSQWVVPQSLLKQKQTNKKPNKQIKKITKILWNSESKLRFSPLNFIKIVCLVLNAHLGSWGYLGMTIAKYWVFLPSLCSAQCTLLEQRPNCWPLSTAQNQGLLLSNRDLLYFYLTNKNWNMLFLFGVGDELGLQDTVES